MKDHSRSRRCESVRWQLLGAERLRQALRHLQQLLAMDHTAQAPALIPIRVMQPDVARPSQRNSWRD